MDNAVKSWSPGQIWKGQRVVILASGPSLTKGDQISQAKAFDGKKIVINKTYEIAPWANLLYCCDPKMWNWYSGIKEFRGIRLTQDLESARKWGINWIRANKGPGLSLEPGVIFQGMNSGYQAINVAVQLGSTEIYLCGYDLKLGENGESHWHGDHPDKIRSNYAPWRPCFDSLADDADVLGIRIYNCNPDSALTSFEFKSLDHAC